MFPHAAHDAALNGRIDAIISDAGSMDAGPYYLGTGTEYFEREAVKADYLHMVEVGKKLGCPVILGSSGMEVVTDTYTSSQLALRLHDAVKTLYKS